MIHAYLFYVVPSSVHCISERLKFGMNVERRKVIMVGKEGVAPQVEVKRD